jgi:hypothetical protein
MTDSQEKKANDSQDSRTINIEIPANCFKGMFNMMAGFNNFGKAGSGWCDISRDNCCPKPEENKGREFNIVIKMKE